MQPSIYTPGAGHRPPVLAGRDELLHSWRLILNDAAARGRPGARDIILTGPRGIGKTAALLAFGDACREQGYEVVNLQAAAGNAGLVDSLVRQAERRADSGAGPWQRSKRAFERIAAINVTVAGFGGGVSLHPADAAQRTTVAPEDLADALAQLAEEVRADTPSAGVLITVDEMQVASGPDLALLAAALHRLNADAPQARVLFAATGLPHTPEVLRAAGVTHPDRLFDIRTVPLALTEQDARFAIVKPARQKGVSWHPDATEMIVHTANRYPAHLQLFADHAWRAAPPDTRTITPELAQQAIHNASDELRERTLAPRVDRLSPREAELLTALALHDGHASTREVLTTLGLTASSELSRVRDALITEGDIYAARRGEMALTVPLLAPFLRATYEDLRSRTDTPLLSLEEMQRNAETIHAVRDASNPGSAQPPLRLPSLLNPGAALQPPTPGRHTSATDNNQTPER
jgi:hypothetical protein